MENYNYNTNLIDKLVKGTLTRPERYELEKAALDDPILFDAIEGYALLGDEDKEKTVLALQLKLTENAHVRQLLPMRLVMGVAASVLLVGAIGFFLMDSVDNNPTYTDASTNAISAKGNPEIAMLQEEPPQETKDEAITSVRNQAKPVIEVKEKRQPKKESPLIIAKKESSDQLTVNKKVIAIPPASDHTEKSIAIDAEIPEMEKTADDVPRVGRKSLKQEREATKLNLRSGAGNELNLSKNTTPTITSNQPEHIADAISASQVETMDLNAATKLSAELLKVHNELSNTDAFTDGTSMLLIIDKTGKVEDVRYMSGCSTCVDGAKEYLKGKILDFLPASQHNKKLLFRLKSK